MCEKFSAVKDSGIDTKSMTNIQAKISAALNSTDMKTKDDAQKTIKLQKNLMIVKINKSLASKTMDPKEKKYGFTHETSVMGSLKR